MSRVAKADKPRVPAPASPETPRRPQGGGPIKLTRYLWVVPALLVLAVVLGYPWLYSIVLSVRDWDELSGTAGSWVGVGNYADVLADPGFRDALVRTGVLAAAAVVTQVVGGLGIALMLHHVRWGSRWFLPMFMMPLILTPAVTGLSWKLFLHEEWGLINWGLSLVGIGPVGWLSDPSWTLFTVIVIDVWQNTPFGVLLIYAALRAMPTELLDAARVDGASRWQSLRYVVLPTLMPVMMIVIVFRLIFVMRTFDVIYALYTSGGPDQAGTVLGVYLYEQLITSWDFGLSSATSFLLVLITAAVCFLAVGRMYRSSMAGAVK